MIRALGPAAAGKVWLKTEDGNYMQMLPSARQTVLANRAKSGAVVEQLDPHGHVLPAAPEDEVERAKVAAMKEEVAQEEVDQIAEEEVYLSVGDQIIDGAHVAQFGAQDARVEGHAVLCQPLLADGGLRNAAALDGAIAIATRGGVSFVEKARPSRARPPHPPPCLPRTRHPSTPLSCARGRGSVAHAGAPAARRQGGCRRPARKP